MRAGKEVAVLLLVVIVAAVAVGQEPPRPKPENPNAAYKLDYVIAEIENGKKVNTRTYTLLTDESGSGSMRLGMKAPLQGEKGPIYMDVGLRIDSRVRSREGADVWLSTRFELSSVVDEPRSVNGALPLRSLEYSTAT